jgi:hypothetical protein
MWKVVDTWHAGSDVTDNLKDEAELQERLAKMLRMAGVKVTEGLEVSGGETDLFLNDALILENKIHGPTASPETAKPAAGMQGRRYAIALDAQLVLVAAAYQPARGGSFKDKAQSVTIHRVTRDDRKRVEIRFALPYGAVVPSREVADKDARGTKAVRRRTK